MKRVFLFLAAVAAAGFASAQPVNKSKHTQFLQMLLQPQQHAVNAVMKTTATKQRVIAQSTLDNTAAALVDSIDLGYTGVRGSTYDYNLMLYPYNYPYSTSPMFNYLGTFTKPQVLYDTLLRWTVNPFTNVYGLYEMAYATYDTTKLTAYKDIFVDSVSNRNMSFMNDFNGAGNITKGQWFNLNMGINDSAYMQFFAYNASNKLIKDSVYEYHLGTWKLVANTFYTYDAANNLTQIDQYANVSDTTFLLPLTEQLKYVNTYDASGRLLTVLTSVFDGTALTQYVKDSFAYTGTNAFHTSWKQYQWDPINTYWAPILYMQKHLNAANRPDTVNTNSFDSLANAWVPYYRDVITYNSVNDPLTLSDYIYNWSSFPAAPSYVTKYYYENYTDLTGVRQVAAANSNALVFPNPTTGSISITKLRAADGAPIIVSFTDIKGQLVGRQSLRYREGVQVEVGNLVPGVYSVMISDNKGSVLHVQQLVKQ
jgi:hypothetical protein